MKEIKLKPCPFCNSEDISISEEHVFYELQGRYGGAAIKIRCCNCDVEMWEHSRFEHDYKKRVEQAVEKWNRRADNETVRHGKWLDTRNMSYSCSECGRYATDITPYCQFCGAKMDGGIEDDSERIS